MKVTCPACSAKYTISDERLDGRRAKVRCKRCGASFPVEPPRERREVYAPEGDEPPMSRRAARVDGRTASVDLFAGFASAGAEGQVVTSATGGVTASAAPFTGERNENSVLFSLAALAKPVSPAAATVTESSALIDIRALASGTSSGGSSASPADDILNLSGGGAFAPLFAPPLVPHVASAIADAEGARKRLAPLHVAAMAWAVIAVVAVASVVGTRAKANAPPVASVVDAPSATPHEDPPASAPHVAVLPSAASAAPTSITPKTARIAPRQTDARPLASHVAPLPTTSATSAPSRCCPGEKETACQMRLSIGVPCGGDSPASSPPFDRIAAARALTVDVASCKRTDGPTGPGHVRVTFQPSGAAFAVEIAAPYAGTGVGACVVQRYRGVSVPAFSGGPMTAGRSFMIE
jgi:predicted Zn finger-like uncharacterized protein